MNRFGRSLLLLCIPALIGVAACSPSDSESSSRQTAEAGISGKIEGGLRVLTLDPSAKNQHFAIFRGDYVRAERAGGGVFTIQVPALGVEKQFPVAEGQKPYFKVSKPGKYPFTAGAAAGVIEAVEFQAAAYREVSSQQAVELIANLEPLVLDVRTPREYASGHLSGAQLIPIQVLQNKLSDIEAKKDDPIFVYCRSGNRSTVAAKILVDHGFTNVVNLRRGIVEWQREGRPVER